MIKIVIVDDEYYVRMGLKTIADRGKYYRVTGEADNGVTALNLILEQDPDIVFLDITIPKLDGIEVLKRASQNGYTGYVTMLTCHDEFPYVQQALRLGADDYVLKTDLVGDAFLEYLDKIRTTKLENGDGGAEDVRVWDEKRTSHQ